MINIHILRFFFSREQYIFKSRLKFQLLCEIYFREIIVFENENANIFPYTFTIFTEQYIIYTYITFVHRAKHRSNAEKKFKKKENYSSQFPPDKTFSFEKKKKRSKRLKAQRGNEYDTIFSFHPSETSTKRATF